MFGSRGAFITGLGIGQIVSWGSLIYSFPLLAGPMAAELGWSKTEIFLLASLALGTAGAIAVPVGTAIDLGHGRRLMAAGSVLSALLLWAWSATEGGWLLFAVFAGIGLAQAMTLYEPAFAVVARRYGPDARQGITALTLWGGFASTVFIPLTQVLLDQFGWRTSLGILALLNLALCVPLHLLVIGAGEDRKAVTAEDPERNRNAVRWAIRQSAFWGLTVAFTVYYATFMGFSFHLYPLLTERGLAAADIVIAMAVIGPAQVAGRIVIATVSQGTPLRTIALATTAVLPAAFGFFLVLGADLPLLIVFAVVYGAANGIMTIVRGAAVPEMLTREAYGAINGLMTMPTAVARALAPALAAMLWQAGGSYQAVVVAAIVASFVVLASLGFAARQ